MLDWIANVTGARHARRAGHVQTLWGGYGEVFRVTLDGGVAPTAIVKHVHPPPSARSTSSDARKRRSYDVEIAFYRYYAPRCDASCRVARLYGAWIEDDNWLLVLEDLDAAGFSLREGDTASPPRALEACLAWLASFHARFLGVDAPELWPIGTYWHLATRTEELDRIRDPALRAQAPVLDGLLSAAHYQTILHGDPKEANFCFAPDGRVAALDFQYAGRGCAMKDVAYLLHGRDDDPASHLDTYFAHLRRELGARDVDPVPIEAEWRALYETARRDFVRFLAGWRG